MHILFRCPACSLDVRCEFRAETTDLTCPSCGTPIRLNADSVGSVDTDGRGRLAHCLVCPSTDLFVRKNFPQRLGVSIVATGFGISCITWYHHQVLATFAVLFATALIDVVLYLLVNEVVECYRCHARYSGVGDPVDHGGFDLEVHERHRQQQARLAESRR